MGHLKQQSFRWNTYIRCYAPLSCFVLPMLKKIINHNNISRTILYILSIILACKFSISYNTEQYNIYKLHVNKLRVCTFSMSIKMYLLYSNSSRFVIFRDWLKLAQLLVTSSGSFTKRKVRIDFGLARFQFCQFLVGCSAVNTLMTRHE